MTQEKIEQEFIDWYYSNYEIIEFEELAREAYLAGRKANKEKLKEAIKILEFYDASESYSENKAIDILKGLIDE